MAAAQQWEAAAAARAEAALPAAAAAPHPAATAVPKATAAADWPQFGKRWAPLPAGFSIHVQHPRDIYTAEHGAV